MTVTAVLASLIRFPFESGIGSDVMNLIAALILGGKITSTIHVLILVPVFFVLMKERAAARQPAGRAGLDYKFTDRITLIVPSYSGQE